MGPDPYSPDEDDWELAMSGMNWAIWLSAEYSDNEDSDDELGYGTAAVA